MPTDRVEPGEVGPRIEAALVFMLGACVGFLACYFRDSRVEVAPGLAIYISAPIRTITCGEFGYKPECPSYSIQGGVLDLQPPDPNGWTQTMEEATPHETR